MQSEHSLLLHTCSRYCILPKVIWAGLFKAGLRQPGVSAKFKFRFESLKSKFSLILSLSKLMIGCS